jgi:DNA-binding winged helix-turn-helix (wHTH) protein
MNQDRTLDSKTLSLEFSSFRPFDRKRLLAISKGALGGGPQLFIDALEVYLESWANSDWVEEYEIERVGIWIAENCHGLIASRAGMLASLQIESDRTNRRKTYYALRKGLTSSRAERVARSIAQDSELVVELDTKTVRIFGEVVPLTTKEFGIIELLSLRKGRAVSKETLLNYLYDGMDRPASKIIDVFIAKLRRKFALRANGKEFIETVAGSGYILRDSDNPIETKINQPRQRA